MIAVAIFAVGFICFLGGVSMERWIRGSRQAEALEAIAWLGYESPTNGVDALVRRCDFDTEMAEWGLYRRDERPTGW